MFELHINDTDATSGNVPVSWCLDKKLIAHLYDLGIENPSVIISVVSTESIENGFLKEYRQVVSLKDLMTYIPLYFSGKSKIYGLISFSSEKYAREHYLQRWYDGSYRHMIVNCSGNYASNLLEYEVKLISKVIEIDVPKECFGSKPPEWEQEWFDFIPHDKLTDQCSYRRRRIFAYTIQPVLFMCNMMIRVLFTILSALLGVKSLSLKYILHPLTYDLVESSNLLNIKKHGTYYIGKTNNKFLNYITLPLMPLVLIVLALAIRIGILFYLLGVAIFIPILIVLCFGIYFSIKRIFNISSNKENEYWYMNQEELDLLICNGNNKPKNVSELPSKHRTLKLRYQDLKSRVCKPFSA